MKFASLREAGSAWVRIGRVIVARRRRDPESGAQDNMTNTSPRTYPPEAGARLGSPIGRIRLIAYPVILVGAVAVYAYFYPKALAGLGAVTPRFRIDPTRLLDASWLIQLHVAGALTSLILGIAILLQKKGTGRHRLLGWIWVVAMTATALSSFGIRTLNPGHYSVIHLISAWALISIPVALAAIRRRDVRTHSRSMTGLFVAGMLVAGLFTLMPGRLMWRLFFEV